jgi:putative holliday junction resolvase
MRSLGLDIGGERTGVAISDPEGILARPLTVLASKDEDALINEILKLAEEHKAGHIVIGLPRRLNGEVGRQASKVTAFSEKLSWRAKEGNLRELDIQLWDERLSTKAAERLRMDAGGKGSRFRPGTKQRSSKRGFSAKAGIDSIAAAFILQGFLDSRRTDSEGT